MPSPVVTFSNGVKMPIVGLGTWMATDAELKAAVKQAIEEGYRLIDTAELYGNEEAVGEAIRELTEQGKIKREDIFVTTKCFSVHLKPADIEPALAESLRKLQLDYVDLYLIHNPCAFKPDMSGPTEYPVTVEEMWRVFEEVYNKRLTRAIGVSNFSVEQIERIMKIASVPIHNHQVEMGIYWPQHEIQAVCKKYNISLTSYATLGSSGRVEFKYTLPNGKPMEWPGLPNPLQDKHVLQLSRKYGKTPAQILLRFAIDSGFAVIPKSIKKERVRENCDLFGFSLTAEDIRLLESSPHRHRIMPIPFLEGHPEDPFKEERKL